MGDYLEVRGGILGWRRGRAQEQGWYHTPRRDRPGSRWRAIMVTSSISQRKAVSGGVRPGGRGRAMVGEVGGWACGGREFDGGDGGWGWRGRGEEGWSSGTETRMTRRRGS